MNLTDINEIRALLSRHGFRFSKSMGQNFLTAGWVPEDIAEGALLDENTGVLEVGPGVGCLTEQLSKRAGKVLCVELDKSLKPVLAETLAGCDNVEIIFGDVLKQNLPELVREHLGGLRPVVCANLPYNVTTPLLTAFIEALRQLKEPCEVRLCSDSQYVINGLQKGWARGWQRRGWKKADGSPALNPDLWAQALEQEARHKITYVWVKGHAGHPENERCDQLAVAQSQAHGGRQGR